MKSRSISILIIAVMAFSCFLGNPVTAFATEEQEILTETVTEYEKYKELQITPSSQLLQQGISAEEIMEIKSTPYEELLYERAQLPVETLRGFGYTESQIQLLKQYEGEELTWDNPVLKAEATCTGTISVSSYGTTGFKFTYNWKWSHLPTSLKTDVVAIRWQGYNSSGVSVDSNISSRSAKVNYVYVKDGSTYQSESLSTDKVDGNSVSAEYKVYKLNSKQSDYVWAKSGSITIQMTRSTTAYQFSHVRVRGAVGHSTNSTVPALSVGQGGVSISFNPSSTTTIVGVKQILLYSNGTVKNE